MSHAPDGTVGTSERATSLQQILTTRTEFEFARTQVWGQFPTVPPEGVINGPDAAQTISVRFQPRMSPKTGTINEKADITPQTITGQTVSVSVNEYGNAIQDALFSEMVSKGDQRSEMGEVIAENMVASLDRLAGREYYEGNPVVYRANNVAARVNLDSTNDTLKASGVGMSFITQATAALRGARAPGFRTDAAGLDHYATVIHTALAQDLPETAGFLPALQYREGMDTLFNGELGELRGLRWTESSQGKLYLGSGTAKQGATTLSASVISGATTIVVASASGLAVGNYVTIGTLEDGSTVSTETDTSGSPTPETNETVLITGVSGTTLTVAGMGYGTSGIDTPGLRHDHDSGVSVIEADTVAAIPVLGPSSVFKAYTSGTGEFGKTIVSGPFDTLQRFVNLGWYAVMGWNRTAALWTVRLEVATSSGAIALNE